MKILFLTQDDPLYILPFFEEFLVHYADRFEIRGVFCSRAMGKRGRLQMARELASLYGTLGFARLATRVLVAKLRGRLPADRNTRRFHSLAQLCTAFDIPCVPMGNPNSPECVEAARRAGADLIVSVACPYLLKEPMLNLAPQGCVNIHHAPLPRFKGMMPTFWQMFHGETKVGVTVHQVVAELDEGPALLQESLAIDPGETLDHLIRRSKRHGAHCVARALGEIEAGTARAVPLDHSQGSYFTFPTIAEIAAWRRKGFRAI
ncbi:MAG: formyl transferase [Pseudomonadota bacterium]|nr:formyl transferase [Pseudomonadota bacterium]